MTKASPKTELNARLSAAQQSYAAALTHHFSSEQQHTQAKRDYLKAEAAAVLGGVIQGKNEQERKANALTTLSAELDAMQRAEDVKDAAAFAVQLAKLEWDSVREEIKVQALA